MGWFFSGQEQERKKNTEIYNKKLQEAGLTA